MSSTVVLLVLTLVLVPAGPARALPPGQQSVAAPPGAGQRIGVGNADAYYAFLQARQLEDDGDIEGAIKLYQEASRLDPSSGVILAELAGLYARENRLREAVATAESALKIAPDTTAAHYILGSIYAIYAQGEQAAQTPASRAAERDYATRAVTHLEAVVAARGATTDPSTLIMLGRLYLRTAAPAKAIPIISRFIEQEPGAMEGTALLAQAYAQAGRTDDAVKVLSEAAGREPSFYAPLGELYERAERWKDAAAAYEKANQAASSPELKRRWALALLNAHGPGDAARARDLLQAVIKDNPKDTRALYLLSEAQRTLNDYPAAEATARQLMATDPSGVTGVYALAQIFQQQHLYRRVVETLQPVVDKAAAQPPGKGTDLTPLLFQLGAAYEREKRFDEAERSFKQVITRDPMNAPALNYLGYMLADRGVRLQESVDYIRRALAVEPKNPAYLDSLGWAYFKMNRLELAETNLRQAVTDRPDDSAVQDHWGDLRMKQGHAAEAIAAWRRALAGDGEDIDRPAIEAKIRSANEKVVRK